MRLINAKSGEVAAFTHRKRKQVGVSVWRTQMYFPKSFCLVHDIKEGQYIHFLNDGSDWKFFVNDDKDGFRLLGYRGRVGTLVIASVGLCSMILKSTNSDSGVVFPVHATIYEQAGKKLFWIQTDRRISRIKRKKS